MSMIEDIAEPITRRLMTKIDDEGRDVPLAVWIEVLQGVIADANMRLEAARDDLLDESRGLSGAD